MAANEKPFVAELSAEQKVYFNQLENEWQETLVRARTQLRTMKRVHKESMTKSMLVGLHGFGAVARVSQPLPYKIGHFTLSQEPVNILAHFEHEYHSFKCTDLVHVDMASLNPALSFCTMFYPAWSENNLFAPLTLKGLENCPKGPTEYLKGHIKAKKWDVIGFKPASLIISLHGRFDERLPSFSYFQFAVELGLQMPERFQQVVFYLPNTLAPIAYAAGFRSNDELQPDLEQQRTHVANACRRAQAVERLPAAQTLFENLEELYRPFYFDLRQAHESNVRIPTNQEG